MCDDCNYCRHLIHEAGDMVPYGDTYVYLPEGYYCDSEEELDDEGNCINCEGRSW
jgi:hypothetical protein